MVLLLQYFFGCSKGIRQGCPLLSLLFILVIEGLSRLINKEKEERKIRGINISCFYVYFSFTYISCFMSIFHLLFVDDVLLLGLGNVEEWKQYKEIIDYFFKTSGMLVSVDKSLFVHNDSEAKICGQIRSWFPFNVENLD